MSTALSFEDLKPEIEMHVRYLNACGKRKWFSKKKIESKQTGEVLDRLDKIFFQLAEHDKGTADNALGYSTATLAMFMVQNGLGEKMVKMWDRLIKCYSKRGNQRLQVYDNVLTLAHICVNLTSDCNEFGEELVANGFVQTSLRLIRLLTRANDDDDNNYHDDDSLNDQILSVLHNCVGISSKMRDVFRRANVVPVLKQCQKSANTSIQLTSLMILSHVVREKEREILASSEVGLRELLHILEIAVNTENHFASYKNYDWSAFGTLDAINHLAINDTNKAEIEKQGAIPAIVRMLQDDFSDSERIVAAETIWNLSFVESIRESEILQDTIPTLEKLVKSSNKKLQGACASALWELKGKTPGTGVSTSSASVEDSSPTYEVARATADLEPSEATPTKIMLSYQWDSKPIVLKIKDILEKARFSVWMDITDMEGDILGAMANGVQKSDVILMCMSERYQESRSCRSEATFAYKLKKKIIPLLLEPGYEPDGWLGLLQGMDLYYPVYSDEELDENMPTLLKRIGEIKSTEDSDTVDGPIQPQVQRTRRALTPAQTASVNEWSMSDVQNWLRENNLGDISTNLARVKGKHLRKLNTQREQNEDAFKEEMKSDYKIYGPSFFLFTDALEELFPNSAKLENFRGRRNSDPPVRRRPVLRRNSDPPVQCKIL